MLVEHFLKKSAEENERPLTRITPEALRPCWLFHGTEAKCATGET